MINSSQRVVSGSLSPLESSSAHEAEPGRDQRQPAEQGAEPQPGPSRARNAIAAVNVKIHAALSGAFVSPPTQLTNSIRAAGVSSDPEDEEHRMPAQRPPRPARAENPAQKGSPRVERGSEDDEVAPGIGERGAADQQDDDADREHEATDRACGSPFFGAEHRPQTVHRGRL